MVTEESILKLDEKLVELFEGLYRVEAGGAATVFAFQRGDVESAKERLSDIKFYSSGRYYRSKGGSPFDLNLWLAVRHALNLQPMGPKGRTLWFSSAQDDQLVGTALNNSQ